MRGTAPIHHASFLTPAGLSGPISSRHVRDPSGPRTRPGIPCCTSRSGLWHAWHDRHQRNFRRGSSSGKRRARRTGALIRAQGCHLRSIAGSAGHQCFGEIHGPASGPPPLDLQVRARDIRTDFQSEGARIANPSISLSLTPRFRCRQVLSRATTSFDLTHCVTKSGLPGLGSDDQ